MAKPTRMTSLSSAEAKEQIDKLLSVPEDKWKREEYKMFRALLPRLPEGLPPKRVAKLLAQVMDVRDLSEASAQVDDAILLTLEAFEKQKADVSKRADAIFVLSALRNGPTDSKQRHKRLADLMSQTAMLRYLGWAKHKFKPTREGLNAIRKRGDIVAGAQAAVAMTAFDDYATSQYVPVLLADASDESLDILLPFVEHVLEEKGPYLDWMRREVVPILADKPKARRLTDMIGEAIDERTSSSPAKAFAKKALGIDPPPDVLQFTISFSGPSQGAGPFQVRVDSTKSAWCVSRRNLKWQYRLVDPAKELAAQIPPDTNAYVLRVSGKATHRAKIDAWVRRTLMP